MMLKNKRVRSEMGKYGITQTKMSELMGESVPDFNKLLLKKEWSKKEQDDAIRLIHEYAKGDSYGE